MKNNTNNVTSTTNTATNIESAEITRPTTPTSIPVSEQETVIQFSRDEDFATICTSDSTVKTKLNRFCKESPDCWVLKEDGAFTTYYCSNKKLISFRKTNVTRELSDEQKQVMSERMKNLAAQRKANREEIE